MKKITYNDIFKLGEKVNLAGGNLRGCWFPEVGELDDYIYGPVAFRLGQEDRLNLRCVLAENLSSEENASIHTLWFDGAPFAIVRNSGYGFDANNRRWITDAPVFESCISYLRTVINNGSSCDDPIVDPAAEIYPEVIFSFAGGYWGDKLGIPREKKLSGLIFLWKEHMRLKNVAEGFELLLKKPSVKEFPEYVRRETFVYKREKPLSEQDLVDNPNLAKVEEGESFCWYSSCNNPPSGAVIVAI